jgi:hypothetical protein
MVSRGIVGDALQGVDAADGHIDGGGAELLDRLAVTVGDLSFARRVQRRSICVMAVSSVLSVVALAASMAAWLAERALRKPTIATVAVANGTKNPTPSSRAWETRQGE